VIVLRKILNDNIRVKTEPWGDKMAKLDSYSKDAAKRARKARVLVSAVLNRAVLSVDEQRYLYFANKYLADIFDTLVRNDAETGNELLDINSLSDIFVLDRILNSTDNEIGAYNRNR
jgi:hypothetical protein